MRDYPPDHYMNTGNAHSPLYVYCADAMQLDTRGLCRQCVLLLKDAETGENVCGFGRQSGNETREVCPFLELDPVARGRMTRRKRIRRGSG